MPMGTPEPQDHNPYDFSHDTSSYRFDPMTGKPLNQNTAQTDAQIVPTDTQPEETTDEDFTHYVHLADGRVLKTQGSVTRWHDSDNPADVGVTVIGVYPR